MAYKFYTYKDALWCIDNGNHKKVEEDSDIVIEMFDYIKEFYPEAYSALVKYYEKSNLNTSYFAYLVVRRFCRCNFGSMKLTEEDVNENGLFNMVKVSCPLRGECSMQGVVCMPKFNSKMSKAEMRVMELYYKGVSVEEIAERLYLSPNTIKNHVKNAYCKIGIHDKGEFIKYVIEHKLFE